MKRVAAPVLLVAAIAAASPSLAVTPEGGRPVRGIAPGDENCDVTVVFGSYAMGIDSESYAKVERYLKRRPKVKFKATNWGREGERTICINAKTDAAARRIYADLEAMAPATANRGPITIRSRFGDSFQSKPPATMR